MSAAVVRSVVTTPWTISKGTFPLRRAATIHDTSPSEPSGPESTTYKALTRPPSTAVRRALRSGVPAFPAPIAKPRSLAPFTFGASVAWILNFASAGCGFSLRFQVMLTSETPSLPSRPSTICFNTNSSSVAA